MAREAKLRCPNCGTQVTVYEDEVGESGHCPGCGSDLEVFRQDFRGEKRGAPRANGKTTLAARVARLVGQAADKEREGRGGTGDEGQPPSEDQPPEDSQDVAMLAELLQDDVEGLTAAEEVLRETDQPEQAEQPEQPPEPAAEPATAEPFAQEVEYRLWQGLAEEAGDRAMAARLALWLRAEQAGCSMTLELPGGVQMPIPQMVLAEAAAAEATGLDEPRWRDGWTRRLLKMAGQWPDEDTVEGVIAVLNHTDAVVADLKSFGVWPWQGPQEAL